MKKIITLLLCLFVFFMAGIGNTVSADNNTVIKVGVYENKPRIFTNEQGVVSGFWPEIIEYIAAEEEWAIQYVHGAWDECLQRLENNEIDVMPNVANTPAWAAKYYFSIEPAYMTWAMVYIPRGTNITSILDLEGKNIAVMKGSNNVNGPDGIKELVKEFNVNCTFVYLDNYTQVFEMLDKNDADAGVVGKDFGYTQEKYFNVLQTPITFQPEKLYFAFPKGSNSSKYFLEKIDSNLHRLKADSNSAYYKSLRKWFVESIVEKPVFPNWVKWILLGISAMVLLLSSGIGLFRYQVRRKTKELAAEVNKCKQTEVVLRASEEKYRVTLDSMMEGCQIIDFSWRYIYLNDTAVKHSRKSREELVGRTMMEVYPGIENAEFFVTLKRCMEDRKPYSMENLFSYADGSQGWFELSMEPIHEGVFVLSIDITERKTAEHALKESEEELRNIFEAVPEGIIITDLNGDILDINQAVVDMLGFESKGEITGRKSREFVGENDREMAGQCIKATLEKGVVRDITHHMIKKDGSEFPVECSTALLKDDLNNPVGVIFIIEDITARLQAEEEHQKIHEYQELDRLKTNLISTISHELRTPLASIKGYASMLLLYDKKLDKQQKIESIEAIDRSTDRLAELIEHLLDMSRLDAGLLRLTMQPVQPGEIITAAIDEARLRTPQYRFKLEISGEIPEIMADGRRLRQVIDNILENAVKYSPEETGITLRLEVKPEELQISITDQGRGINKTELIKIFERMYRIEQRLQKDPGGMGLGLSLCKALVEAHGGRIWAESKIGQGSTFYFTLPLKSRAKENTNAETEQDKTSTHH